MNGQTKLIFPGLAGFYESMMPIAGTLVRVIIGIMFLMHVSGKFNAGAAAVAANVMAKNGLEPSLLFAYAAIFLESVGGICLIVGLFTRFFAAALAIEMLIALLAVHLSKGYAAGGGGYAIPSDATATSAAASGGGSAAAAGTVVAKSIAYHPDKITVKVGEKVTFKNEDSFAHTFTADNGEFDSSNVDGGGEFAFVPEQAGTIAFHCKIHPTMKASLLSQGSSVNRDWSCRR